MVFTLSEIHAGWALARIGAGNKVVAISASSTPKDVLRDFIDAVQSLVTTDRADCCWFQEPGEMHWRFRRRSAKLEIEILAFDHVSCPGCRGDGGKSVFAVQTDWLSFAEQVRSAFASLLNLGAKKYELAWHYAFPTEAFDKLDRAIRDQAILTDGARASNKAMHKARYK
ncbi:MAG TPA: hypothetical protein VKZ53_10140 [Candidatus Angelobacter sp.]|nr:hypothetical protein [Candidatus Angelobacter sp.]